MSKAIITIEDKPESKSNLHIEIDFGEEGVNSDSYAHILAVRVLEFMKEISQESNDK